MGEPAEASTERADAAVAKIKRLDWIGTGFVALAAVAFAALIRTGWSWPYFVWGVGAGLFAVAYMRASMWLAYQVIPASEEERARAREKSRSRWRGFHASVVVYGGAVGVMAASARAAWPDILFTAFVLLSQVPAFLALPRLRRKALAARQGS
jgi:hypothetical protein